MDRKKLAFWTAIVALLTGAAALGTNVVILTQKLDESQAHEQEQERKNASMEQQLASQRIAYEQQLTALRQALSAQEHSNLCDEHATTRAAVEARFSSLMEAHGTLMNAMRECLHGTHPEDQQGCLTAVCVGAAWWTEGRANCAEVGADAAAIKADLERENQSAAADNCQVPGSPILGFFN